MRKHKAVWNPPVLAVGSVKTSSSFWKFVRLGVLPFLQQFEPQDHTIKVIVHPENFSVPRRLGKLSFSDQKGTQYEVYSTDKQALGVVEVILDKASCKFPLDGILFGQD